MRDVADQAGVSPATVSRFLNGGISLSDETAARIKRAVQQLDYRANPIARSLGRGVSDAIGLSLPDLSNPFFGQLAASLERVAQERGRSIMLGSTMNSLEGEISTIERLERGYFDLVLFATNRVDDGTLAEAINRNAWRMILLDEDVPGALVPKVFSDNRMGGRLAGQALTQAGHAVIAYIGGPARLMSSEERGAGLRDGAGPVEVVTILCGDYDADHGYAGTLRLLRERSDVTGIFYGSDVLLLGGLTALREADLRIGQDISVISFDDVGPLAFFAPPITAIRHRLDALAEEAFVLVEALTSVGRSASAELSAVDERHATPEIRVPVDLVVRASIAGPSTTPKTRTRPRAR